MADVRQGRRASSDGRCQGVALDTGQNKRRDSLSTEAVGMESRRSASAVPGSSTWPVHQCAGARDGTICPSRQIVSTVARPTLACKPCSGRSLPGARRSVMRRQRQTPRFMTNRGVWDEAPGSDLLSHGLSHTTIGAGAFHFRVRDGNGWDHAAVSAREAVEVAATLRRGAAHSHRDLGRKVALSSHTRCVSRQPA